MRTADRHIYSTPELQFPNYPSETNPVNEEENQSTSDRKPSLPRTRPDPGQYATTADNNYGDIDYVEQEFQESGNQFSENQLKGGGNVEKNLDGYGNSYSQGQREQIDNKRQKVSKSLPEVDINATICTDPDIYSMPYCTLPKRPKSTNSNSIIDKTKLYERSDSRFHVNKAKNATVNSSQPKLFGCLKKLIFGSDEDESSVYESSKNYEKSVTVTQMKPIMTNPFVAYVIIFVLLLVLCITFSVQIVDLKSDVNELRKENEWLKKVYREFELELIGNYSGSLLNRVQNLDNRVYRIENNDSMETMISSHEKRCKLWSQKIANMSSQIEALSNRNLSLRLSNLEGENLTVRIETLENLNFDSHKTDVHEINLQLNKLEEFVSITVDWLRNEQLHNRIDELNQTIDELNQTIVTAQSSN